MADETVLSKTTLDFFTAQANSNSRLLAYTSALTSYQDSRITCVNSYLPEQGILNFSHVCLPIAPTNPHYGRNGDYQEPWVSLPKKNAAKKPAFLGALNPADVCNYTMQRLTFNPYFNEMSAAMQTFLHKIMRNRG